ncbi:helix-turn-helix domain-containing protein [Sphingomonas sp. R647]|uniref:helix-turn-helix domain-containing protein n=1 Tax=Sphingomonas sp. R647 TaxID=2875233 RepID=UPI001CD47388|nr:helix-turn-helix transcriptional regulator [Sphingomonas sp. R647]MCA1199159.1 helix-turn-helix domain-containing protein [Sphingomonas sp. R647]
MSTDVVSLSDVGARLRSERERLGVNQEAFGLIGGVTRNSQATYEAGRRPCDASYLLSLLQQGIDVGFIITGTRASDQIAADEAELLDCFRSLVPGERMALLTIARSMRGHPAPSNRVHATTGSYHGESES